MTSTTRAAIDGIDFYYWPTPNGQKVAIFLEEAQVDYRVCPIDISQRAQFTPEFERVSPNHRIPAIVDGEFGLPIFESGAILLYLAEKSGQFIPATPRERAEVLQWLFWQVGGLGPMLGQSVFFSQYAPEKLPLAIDRFGKESVRLYNVLNKRLADRDYLAGTYSIADMAAYPWVAQHAVQGVAIDEFPHVARWLERIRVRPAVKRAYALGETVRPSQQTDAQRKKLFADTRSALA